MSTEDYAALAWDYKQEAEELERAAQRSAQNAFNAIHDGKLDEAVRLLYEAVGNVQGAQIDRAAQAHNERMAEKAE